MKAFVHLTLAAAALVAALPASAQFAKAEDAVKYRQGAFQIIKSHFRGLADVFIHVDPCVTEECAVCAMDPCGIRGAAAKHLHLWRPHLVTTEQRAGSKPVEADMPPSVRFSQGK